MATGNNISLPEPLLAEIQSAAQAENRSVEEILQEAIRQYLDNRSWTKILGYGQRRAKELGLTEADIDRAIAETRAEQHRR